MILPISKTTKLKCYFGSRRLRLYATFQSPKPKAKPRDENPHHSRKRRHRRNIPFVTNVKETQDSEDALALFQEYRREGFRHDYPSYSALIYKLARSGDFEAVEGVLGQLQAKNLRCGENLFVALFGHYGKANLVDKAVELFDRMPQFNCERTSQSFNALLNVLVDNDRLVDAKQLFGRSRWLCRGDWDQARQVFDEMLERKVEPTVVTYNSLIGHLCRKGEIGKARDFFDDMVKKGKPPNEVTYALLMEGLCSLGEYAEAKKVMFDMEYRGCKPKVLNFGILMNDLGKRGKIEEAKSLLLEMKKRRFKPDVVTYNILVNYLCKEGRVTEAYKVLFEMQIGGCEANAATYRMLVDGFCRHGDFEGGLKVLTGMLASRHSPRTETFSCLVGGLLKSGNVEGAGFVLEEMQNRKLGLELDSWEGLIKDYSVSDEKAGVLVNELISDVNSD
ncbi:unnamed protein product [Linum tenue]|uniref:Pentatricopeptide repeat-containing protein n=1 Tax=Linum tenue TaxID=586396 RepID=A0AAV0PXS7_9ROSI|nr:unnamed protein product [Linum tenue]